MILKTPVKKKDSSQTFLLDTVKNSIRGIICMILCHLIATTQLKLIRITNCRHHQKPKHIKHTFDSSKHSIATKKVNQPTNYYNDLSMKTKNNNDSSEIFSKSSK